MIKRPELVNKRVLIVDDDDVNIFALKTALNSQKMLVSVAIDGLEALKKLKEEAPFDIILMDMRMPNLSGYETILQIRSFENLKNIPIIGLTAQAMQGDKEKVLEAGANIYISKPVKLDNLTEEMTKLILS